MSTDDQDATVYPFTPAPPPVTPPPVTPPSGRPRRPRRSRLTKTAAGLALILGTGTGVGAVVLATSSSPSSLASASAATSTRAPGATTTDPSATTSDPAATTTTTPSSRRRWQFRGGPGGLGPMSAAPFGALGGMGQNGVIHGSYTLKGPNGDYETVDTQYGTAVTVTSTSITVKSADGFSQTYQVGPGTIVDANSDGITSVAVGDDISVQALVSGSTVTAERVVDLTQIQANGKSWAPAGGGAPFGPHPFGPPTSGGTDGDDNGPGPAAA